MQKLGLIRLAAYAIDYSVISIYIAVLVFANLVLFETETASSAALIDKVFGHAIAFATLTFPVWLYFTAQESGGKNATIGKVIFGLKVQGSVGNPPGLRSVAVRNLVKFLPWELAHIAIWYVPGRPFLDGMPLPNRLACIAAMAVGTAYVAMLFFGKGQTLYDRLSHTVVIKFRV